MALKLKWMVLGTVMASCLLAPMALAQTASDVRVDLNLKDAEMLTATRLLTQRTGIQFVVEPSSKPFQRITLQLTGQSAEDAIRYICMAAGATFRRDDNGVYVISHSESAPKPETAPTTAKKKKLFRTIKVLKADARDIYELVMTGKPPSTSRGFDDIRRMNGTYGPNLNPIGTPNNGFNSNVYPVQPTVSRPLAASNSESGNNITLPGDEGANQIGGMGGMGGGMGGFGGGQGGLGGGQGGLGGGQGGLGGGGGQVNLLPGNNLIPEGIDFVSYDPNDNSLIVQADSEEAINRLQNIISTVDVAPRQIIVKVEYITTTEQLDRSLGYEFLFQRGSVYAGTRPGAFIRQSDPIFLSYATGNVAMRFRAALSEGRGKVVQAPILRTLNNQPASLFSTVITYAFLTQASSTVGGVLQGTTITPIFATSSLSIAPRINDDGTVTMSLSPQITALTGVSRDPSTGQEIPNQTSQFLNVVVRVKDRETVVLGGFNDKNESESTNRVPILSELPIIGQFFRSSRKSRSNSELLVFVTPEIVNEDQSFGGVGP